MSGMTGNQGTCKPTMKAMAGKIKKGMKGTTTTKKPHAKPMTAKDVRLF